MWSAEHHPMTSSRLDSVMGGRDVLQRQLLSKNLTTSNDFSIPPVGPNLHGNTADSGSANWSKYITCWLIWSWGVGKKIHSNVKHIGQRKKKVMWSKWAVFQEGEKCWIWHCLRTSHNSWETEKQTNRGTEWVMQLMEHLFLRQSTQLPRWIHHTMWPRSSDLTHTARGEASGAAVSIRL